MQLVLRLKPLFPLELPINYNHILQGIIYNALADYPGYSELIHDEGVGEYETGFKPFTFGPLEGRYKVRNKRIKFTEAVTWEIRSIDPVCIKIVYEHFKKYGITFGEKTIRPENIELYDHALGDDNLIVRMRSPVCVYTTDPRTKQTYFYTPEQRGFYELIKSSAEKKYSSFFPEEEVPLLNITPYQVKRSDELATRFKGFIMFCWGGEYKLAADNKMLNLLYQTGLGGKGAQGFGMFDVVEVV